MKRFLTIALFALLAVALVANFAMAAKYKDGEFIGYVPNERGDLVVSVSIVKGFITNVEIVNPVKHTYSYAKGKDAFYQYPAKVVAKQSATVDAVAGATSSYKEYNAAVKMALDTAAGTYSGNKYYGLYRDYGHGHILVEVTLSAKKDKIEAVRFITANADAKLKDQETLMADKVKTNYPYAPGKTAFQTFPGKVVKAQSVKVDAVAGATHSNVQFFLAALQAVENAGVSKNFQK